MAGSVSFLNMPRTMAVWPSGMMRSMVPRFSFSCTDTTEAQSKAVNVETCWPWHKADTQHAEGDACHDMLGRRQGGSCERDAPES